MIDMVEVKDNLLEVQAKKTEKIKK